MTIATSVRTAGPYTGTGAVSVYPFAFKVFQASDLLVNSTNTLGAISTLVLSSDYSVTLNADQDNNPGGTINLTAALASGYVLNITSNVPATQSASLTNGGGFFPKVIEGALDRLTILLQQTGLVGVVQSLRVPEIGGIPVLPAAAARANRVQAYDSAGNPIMIVGVDSSSAAALALDLAASGNPAKGTGLIAHDRDNAYPIDTLGRLANGTPISALEFHTGTVGVQADDLAAVNAGITAIKGAGRGTLLIPAFFNKSFATPALGLSANQSMVVIDMRADKPNSGSEGFGVLDFYVEARDGSGGYASEVRVKGKQNPAWTLQPLSDGTAPGYPIANNGASLLFKTSSGLNNVQLLADPLFRGMVGDFGLMQYAQGTSNVAFACYFGVDANNKTRVDFSPVNLASSTINVSSVTNTTPIVVNLVSPHGIVATRSPVSIAGIGAGVNGSWIASITGAAQLTLLNSVAAGAFGAVGTATVKPNAQRATLTVPKTQGGTEAIVAEGVIASAVAQGTAPITAVSQTADVNLHARPYVLSTSGTQQVSGTPGSGAAKIVTGSVPLVAGTATVTLTGDAVFTGSGTYTVAGSNATNANPWKVAKSSGSVFTITGTGTDTINFIAVGY